MISDKLNKIKISKSLRKEITRYVISFFFAWLISALISDFPFFREHLVQSIKLDGLVRNNLMGITENTLNFFSIPVFIEDNFLQTAGTAGVTFNYGCLGFRELAFFVIFILLQTGAFKNKLWYIPSGIALLHFLNILRIQIIVVGQYKNPDQFQTIHDIVSPAIMYPTILFLWLFWLKKYAKNYG